MEKTIDLGCGYRLKRLDARNWKTQHWHVSERGSAKAGEAPAWYDTGNYFQHLDAALLWAYEHALLNEGEGAEMGLADAIAEAKSIRDSIVAAAEAVTL